MPAPRRPDGLETGLRLGCGGLTGLFLVGPFLLRIAFRLRSPLVAQVGVPLAVVVFATLAYRMGDELWDRWAEGRLLGDRTYTWIALFLAAVLVAIVIWIGRR